MARFIRKRRPSPAMIVAIIACILATAGTSYAALGLKDLSRGARIQTLGAGPLVYSTSQNFISAGQIRTLSAGCPPKLEVIGGGVRVSPGAQVIEGVVDSYPSNFGWVATVFNNGAESHTAIVTAICAKTERTRGTVGGF